MPPPIPHTNTGSLLSADGAPMPPPIPHGILAGERSASVLIADGAPMPPPIPHTGNGLAA